LNLDEWASSDFTPVPLRVSLEPIAELLTPLNFEPSDEYGIPAGINLTYLHDLFNEVNPGYCTDILGLTASQCESELTGCGYNGYCAFGMTCMNDPESELRFTCGTMDYVCVSSCFLIFAFLVGNDDQPPGFTSSGNISKFV